MEESHMGLDYMRSEFGKSLGDCDDVIHNLSMKLELLEELDSSYLGSQFSPRIRELCERLVMMKIKREEIRDMLDRMGSIEAAPPELDLPQSLEDRNSE